MKQILTCFLVLGCISPAHAQIVTAPITISMSLIDGCIVTGGSADYGEYTTGDTGAVVALRAGKVTAAGPGSIPGPNGGMLMASVNCPVGVTWNAAFQSGRSSLPLVGAQTIDLVNTSSINGTAAAPISLLPAVLAIDGIPVNGGTRPIIANDPLSIDHSITRDSTGLSQDIEGYFGVQETSLSTPLLAGRYASVNATVVVNFTPVP